MQRIRVPSPATVVSLVALFVALGGSAYAISLPRGSVGAKQIKKNAVRSAEIKKDAVRGSDVRDDALTGLDVAESTLGRVPAAARADVATSAASAQSAANAVNAQNAQNAASATQAGNASTLGGKGPGAFVGTDEVQRFFHRMSGGETKVLARVGSLTLTAECSDGITYSGSPDQDVLRILISTTKDGATFVSDTGGRPGGPDPSNFLNTDTAEDARIVYADWEDDGTVKQDDPIDSLAAIDPDGNAFSIGGRETLAVGLNLAGADCVVGGVVFELS